MLLHRGACGCAEQNTTVGRREEFFSIILSIIQVTALCCLSTEDKLINELIKCDNKTITEVIATKFLSLPNDSNKLGKITEYIATKVSSACFAMDGSQLTHYKTLFGICFIFPPQCVFQSYLLAKFYRPQESIHHPKENY
jgi:hypothetical protein